MAGQLLVVAPPALDTNASPYSGAKWYFYQSGTSTPLAVYADAGLTTSLGAVVTADSAGRFVPIYLDPQSSYRAVLKNSDGSATVSDIDPVNTDVLSQFALDGGAGLVGFSHDATYADGSAGLALQQRVVSVKDKPFSAKGDGVSDDAPAFLSALAYLQSIGGGVLFVPRGLYIVFAEIKVPSAVTVMGSGVGVTIVKAHISLPSNQNVLTNAKNNRLERTDYDEHIHISGLTVDANHQERDSTPSEAQGACIKFSTVRDSSIKNVEAINGVLHCIDIAASTYFDDGNINHNAVGPSLDILVEDCIARQSSRDDGITTHNSGRIVINRCQSYFDRTISGPPLYNQHGVEIDEGSWEVSVLDCYAKGWQAGFQVKGHTTTMPAINVHLARCFAEECSTGFHIEHLDPALISPGQVPYARNVSLRDCRAKTIAATPTNPDANLISIRGYRGVTIDGFAAEDIGASFIALRVGASNTVLRNIVFWDASTLSGLETGLIHGYATLAVQTVIIDNVTSNVAQPVPVVRMSSSLTVPVCTNVFSEGSDPAVPCIWLSRNTETRVKNVRQTGFSCDVRSENDGVNFSNFVELDRGLVASMRGAGSPEGVVAGPVGSQYFRTGASASYWVKTSASGNTGWKLVTQAA